MGTHFDDRPQILTFRQISPNIFLLTNCPMKITVGPADLSIPDMNRVNWLQQRLSSDALRICIYHCSKWYQKHKLVFWKELVCVIFKALLTFLTFVNYEGPYFGERFLLNFRPCFDIAFGQLGVIPRTKNKFVEIEAIAECYLITNHVKNIKEAAVPNVPSWKISWWKNVREKGEKQFRT